MRRRELTPHTLRLHKAGDALTAGDSRPRTQRRLSNHATSAQERAQLLSMANEVRSCAGPPVRIVPILADELVYLASESSFIRVLREQGQSAHHGRAKAARPVSPPSAASIATARLAVRCWDMTFCLSPS